jgi:hypothetical protein
VQHRPHNARSTVMILLSPRSRPSRPIRSNGANLNTLRSNPGPWPKLQRHGHNASKGDLSFNPNRSLPIQRLPTLLPPHGGAMPAPIKIPSGSLKLHLMDTTRSAEDSDGKKIGSVSPCVGAHFELGGWSGLGRGPSGPRRAV